MKNQYFGDARDYFKYDVLESLLSADPLLEQLSCIWMLTPPDNTGQGQVQFVADPELPELTHFFGERQDPARRQVSEMPAYLGRRGHRVYSHRDDREDFSSQTRRSYFASIPDEALRGALVFFDPDNGLEPLGGATEKHLRFSDLEEVFARMDTSSVAVVFQYFRRVPDFWESMAGEIGRRLARDVLFIAEPSSVAFYVIAKDLGRLATLEAALQATATRHTPRGRGSRRVGRSAAGRGGGG